MALNFANNNSLSAIDTKPSGLSGGALNLISTQTASSSSTISFTSGIDDTYDSYVFKFYDIHPETDRKYLSFQGSTNSGSSYGVTATTTFFQAQHFENDSSSELGYTTAADLAQSTSFQPMSLTGTSADNDACFVGQLQLFNPSSTTFVKHFIMTSQNSNKNSSLDRSNNCYVAGYFNTTSAVNGIQFKFSSGNIDSGVIKLYGVS